LRIRKKRKPARRADVTARRALAAMLRGWGREGERPRVRSASRMRFLPPAKSVSLSDWMAKAVRKKSVW
jgi:hypothetical protein